MTALVIVTHSGLAGELLKAASMICGNTDACEAVELHPDDPPEQLMGKIAQAVEKVGGNDNGLMLMTDMFGGTPSNTGMSFLKEGAAEVLTGVNLPMVVEFLSRREKLSFEELATVLQRCGRESIIVAGEFLKK